MFVSFRLLVVESIHNPDQRPLSYLRWPVRAARFGDFARPRFAKTGNNPKPASISDATIQMDHNAVILFTIDRLARSPRTTVR